MSAPDRLTLRTRIDDYSLQVSAAEDERFWFRLERHEDRDVITDFFPGSAPEPRAGLLLADCYRVLGITPKPVIVFRDILPSTRPVEIDDALTAARDFYTACGKSLLTHLGAGKVVGRLVKERDKYNLVLEVVRDVPATPREDGRD
jgi:hypothetical protein